ncbi:protein phosphatase 2C domain-containing protein [Micromonospora sp. DH14]|uniref:protein phosphatase 2C domain-containing protein n=1 Tax=Micromonospora sp. DH14 TaxID=3040120 RepID=UPI00244261F4|nr:protein phosphatase 2C domain-containing protein [Micromonospora sp. DH14]MDG9673809.1 protein phosphatase 2C domain-containing protein [Micromonospora sp. DH14]
MATSAGTADRPNEDFVGAVPGAVVLLDGAGIPGSESLCRHGVAWYTHRLGGALLGQLSRGDGRGLAAILATAIDEIAAEHGDTCDIADPSSPQATVAMVRAHHRRLDWLLLADCFVVLDRADAGPQVLTDERETTARRECSAPLAGLVRGTPEYDRVRAACVTALRARRNQPGGYWIAKDDPRAAREAVTGSRSLAGLNGVALLSNGASRIVSPYAQTDWPGVLDLLRASGPAGVIARVRRAEAQAAADADALAPDDATVAHCAHLAR